MKTEIDLIKDTSSSSALDKKKPLSQLQLMMQNSLGKNQGLNPQGGGNGDHFEKLKKKLDDLPLPQETWDLVNEELKNLQWMNP